MAVNKIVTKVDGVINKTINFNDLKAGLAAGSHTITVEAFNGSTLISTQTRNITIASSDSTAPTITTATVEDANPDKLVVVFSEVVTITNTTGLTITGAATPTLNAPTGSGSTTITFTLSTALTNGQSVTLNVSSSNTIKDTANNALAATTRTITNNVAAPVSYEAKTTDFMNAVDIPDDANPSIYTGVSNNGVWLAVDKFVKGLQTNSILTKMKAIYPFIGGTAATHKWNLINPQDTDAAYRLVFFGSMVHSKTGMEGNGTNTYANTKAVHNVIFTLGNESFGSYLGSGSFSNSDTECDMGVRDNDSRGSSYFYSKYQNGMLSRSQTGSGFIHTFSNVSVLGLHLVNRASLSSYRMRKRDQTITEAQTSLTLTSLEIPIGGQNLLGSLTSYSSKEFSFSFMGEGLTITEENNLVIAINQLQTDLKRNV